MQSPRLVERFGPSAARLALAIALVWVVHPLCTQSVTYLYQRLESLMGMFYLTSLYAFVRFAERRRWGWAAAAVVSCLLAAATKEVAVTAPIMILWYDRALVATSWEELLRRRGVVHAMLFASLVVPATLMVPMLGGTYQSAGILDTSRITVAQYARTQPEVVQHYLRLALVPWPLNIDYAWRVQNDWQRILPPAALVGGLGVLTLVAAWKRPALGFVGGWWFVILGPTSSFAPIIDLAFEHRTYLPLIAPVALIVTLAYVAVGRCIARFGGDVETAGACRAALLTIYVAALTTLTIVSNHDYRSELALWRDVAEKVPHSPRAHYNYGVYLQMAGSAAEMDEAIREYHETIRLDPSFLGPDAHFNIANIAKYRREWQTAKHHYEQSLERKPDNFEALHNLAETLEQLGERDEALRRARRAIELAPTATGLRELVDRLAAAPTQAASR
jgi:tetratricopeptide (TPR) repeat protein